MVTQHNNSYKKARVTGNRAFEELGLMKGGNQGERKRTFTIWPAITKSPPQIICCTEENRELGNLRREQREKISHNSEGKNTEPNKRRCYTARKAGAIIKKNKRGHIFLLSFQFLKKIRRQDKTTLESADTRAKSPNTKKRAQNSEGIAAPYFYKSKKAEAAQKSQNRESSVTA